MDKRLNDFIRSLKRSGETDDAIAELLHLSIEEVSAIKKDFFVSEEEKAEMISRYQAGETITEIIKDYPYSRNTVYKIIKQHCTIRGKRITKEEAEIIRNLAKKGKKAKEISDLLDITFPVVYKQVKDIVPKKTMKYLTEEERMKIIELYSQGIKSDQLAEQYGVDRSTIYRIIQRQRK